MKYVFARVLTAAVLVSTAVSLSPLVTVEAKSGPDNPGHHYGQKKHQHAQPPPGSGPSPGTQLGDVFAGATSQQLTLPNLVFRKPTATLPAGFVLARRWDAGAGLEGLLLLVLPLLLVVWAIVFARVWIAAGRRAPVRPAAAMT